MPVSRSFYDVVADAVRDVAEHGFDSEERVARWAAAIRDAARASLVSPSALSARLREALGAVYRAQVDGGKILKLHPGVSRFTLASVAPRLHAELERRLAASADLIVLNRERAVEETLQRFRGWSSSVPAGGSRATNKTEEAATVRRALSSLPFVERRCAVDQSFKFVAALSDVIAKDAGAIGMIWRSHWRQPGYDYREDHRERDGRTYPVRGSWAAEAGFVRPGADGWLDEITQPGQEVSCRCFGTYIYALGRLPHELLTRRGEDELKRVREAVAA
jgi:hypothetical protein